MNKNTKVEIERKYIIALPCAEDMKAYGKYTVSTITQSYIPDHNGVTHRVRMREYPDRTEYTETVKVRIDSISAYEDEREIDEAKYLSIIEDGGDAVATLKKTRHTFEYLGQLFEIDVYPEWKNTCIMETELKEKEATPKMPPLIKIIAEVTGDRRYSNASMSRKFPPEIL